ncbi:MAG TPA: FAD-dependent oxidoreductase, partial [Candidatus Binataceae bacterium]|nr:FAD-dependent oxidoreductase [Candidatus Binataceae bacterium]
MSLPIVNVIGAGLAGSEAAFARARRGVRVRLHEMRPVRMTEAHQTALFGELVCSNSLRSDSMDAAVGVLKEEMRRLGSLVIAAADRSRVPAGSALAVDRDEFARALTDALSSNPMVEVVREEVTAIPDGPTILASGPLT